MGLPYDGLLLEPEEREFHRLNRLKENFQVHDDCDISILSNAMC